MVPAAVDLIKPPTPEPPASGSSSMNEFGGPSFRQHLEQAGKRTAAEAESRRDDADRGPANEAASQQSRETSASTTNKSQEKPTEKPATAETDEQPPVENDDSPDEHDADDETSKQDEAHAAIAAAAVVKIVAEETHGAATDEITLTREVAAALPDEANTPATPKPTALATGPVIKAAANIEAVPVEPTQEATAPQIEVRVAELAQKPKTVEPVVEKAEASIEPTAVNHDDPVAPPTNRPEFAAASLVAASSTAGKVETPADDGEKAVEKSEGNQTDHVAVPETTPVEVAVASASAATEIVGTGELKSSDDGRSKKEGPHDAIGRIGDGEAANSRSDAPSANNEPPRSATHRDAGTSQVGGGEHAPTLSNAERVRLVQRVARAVQTAQDRGGDLKLRLSPPELGSLRLQVRMTDGIISARIEAETPGARQVLVDNLPALRERLAEQNIRVEKFDVDLFHSGGGASQMPQQQFQQDDVAGRSGASRREPAGAGGDADAERSRSAGPTLVDGRLNVVI